MTKTGATFERICLGRTERFPRAFPEIQGENQGQIQWIAENPQRLRNIWLLELKISWFGAQGKYGGKLVVHGKARNLEFTIGGMRNFLNQEKEEKKKKEKYRDAGGQRENGQPIKKRKIVRTVEI